MKKVSFHPETITPKKTIYCHNCRHRNIPPKIKDIFVCMICSKQYCIDCITSSFFIICVNCTNISD